MGDLPDTMTACTPAPLFRPCIDSTGAAVRKWTAPRVQRIAQWPAAELRALGMCGTERIKIAVNNAEQAACDPGAPQSRSQGPCNPGWLPV